MCSAHCFSLEPLHDHNAKMMALCRGELCSPVVFCGANLRANTVRPYEAAFF